MQARTVRRKCAIIFEIHGLIKLYSVSYDQLKKSCQSNFIYAIHKFSLWVRVDISIILGTDALVDAGYLMLDH